MKNLIKLEENHIYRDKKLIVLMHDLFYLEHLHKKIFKYIKIIHKIFKFYILLIIKNF